MIMNHEKVLMRVGLKSMLALLVSFLISELRRTCACSIAGIGMVIAQLVAWTRAAASVIPVSAIGTMGRLRA
jgi:hypothetical protein